MKDTLVIGIGSVLRGDDGVGPRVIDELEKNEMPGHVALRKGDLSGMDLIKYFPDFKRVIIIDAADMGEKPGTVKVLTPEDVISGSFKSNTSTHGLALPETLALSERVGIKTQIRVIGIQPEDTSFALELSDNLAENIPEVVRAVKSFI